MLDRPTAPPRHLDLHGSCWTPALLSLRAHGGTTPKVFHFQVLNNARLSPVAISTTVYNALHGVNEYGDETTYAMKGAISVGGFPEVRLEDMLTGSSGRGAGCKWMRSRARIARTQPTALTA